MTAATTTPSSKRSLRARLLAFLAVVGPGFITANVDNDAGGIWIYSVAGAQFGYAMLWTMIPTTVALVVVQEMAARMGAVTGKGLSDLIREEFGFRITFFLMLALVATNFGNIMAEFAGIASSLQLFGVSRYVVVPLAAAFVWVLVVQGTYHSVEKIFLMASGFYVCYIVAGILAHPDWRIATEATLTTPAQVGFRNYGYLYMVIGLVGTTIAPWMQFYLQASVVEKGITPRQYRASRWDVIIGCLFAAMVAWFIIVACAATLNRGGVTGIRDAADAAQALRPLAGQDQVPLVRGRPLQCVALCGLDSADLDLVRGLRGSRLRVRPGQEVPRSARVLLALHGADRDRRGCLVDPQLPPDPRHGPVAGRQRRPAPVRPVLHAELDQRSRVDGRTRQLASLQRRGLDHRRGDARAHHCDAPYAALRPLEGSRLSCAGSG